MRAKRYVRPKSFSPMTAEQGRIADDWMHYWHTAALPGFDLIEKFNHGYPLRHLPEGAGFRTIEIGAGSGGQLAVEDLTLQDYHCVELREAMAAELRSRYPTVTVVVGNCERQIPYADDYFDRATAVHVLEHLQDLPSAVSELYRVLRPGAMLWIVIPCDPGLAYEIARITTSERLFRRRYKMSYRWLMRREHVNSPPRRSLTVAARTSFD